LAGIRKGEVLSLTSIHGVDAEILEFEVQENSRILNEELRNLDFPTSAIIGGVIRKGKGYIPMGSFEFQPKDRVVVLTMPDCVRKTEAFFK
jgi:trk system potassium uptake protein TrkA